MSDVTRLGSRLVNFYAVEADGSWTVFDAGVPGYWPQLERHGIRPAAVEAVVLTHAHADHVGVAERLREAGAAVFVHADDEGLARTARAFGKNEASLLPYLRHAAAWRLLVELARNGGARPQRIRDVNAFADGERLDVPGRPLAIHTPGHTDGHVAFYLEERNLLIAGDVLCTLNPLTGRRGPQLMPRAFNRSSQRVLESLGRLESVDAQTLLVGHGEPWTDGVASAVERARELGPT